MKMTQAVKVALNGDAETVDPAVRRTLYSIAGEFDDHEESVTVRLENLGDRLTDEVKGVRRLLIGLTGTVIAGLLVAIANILLAL